MRNLFLISIVLSVLAGCGGVGGDDTSQPLVLTPPGDLTQDGICEDTVLLEDWLQSTEFYQMSYIDLLQNAPGQSRTELYPQVANLNDELVNYAAMPAPDCAAEVQAAILTVMQTTLTNLQAYVNGDREDLGLIIEQAQTQFSASRPGFDLLILQMEQQYRQLIPTPTGQGS